MTEPVPGAAAPVAPPGDPAELLPAARRPSADVPPVGSVVAVCVTHALVPDHMGAPTGIDKRTVTEVALRADGVAGDRVLDTRHHGGPDKAVYAYADEDARWWSGELGRDDVTPGWFGENLVLRGVDVSGALVGERWRIGAEVVVEVTQPRIPCRTFQHRTGEAGWQKRFLQAGRPGAYLRVQVPGTVRPGDPVVVEHRPDHGVTIGRWVVRQDPADARALLAAEQAGLVLAASMVAYVEAAARRG